MESPSTVYQPVLIPSDQRSGPYHLNVDIRGWDERYRTQARAAEDPKAPPTRLILDTARRLAAATGTGKALDLACGTGRNALWLAGEGWQVRAIDGSAAAIEVVRERARQQGLTLVAQVADLQSPTFSLPEEEWNLVAICYYLQRNLMERAKNAVTRGGILLAIVHITEGDEDPTESRLRPGELTRFFSGWEILHQYEGKPDDPAHKRSVAEVVARRPVPS